MIAEIANLLEDYPGPANQTRCFTHVLNLVVKSIIRQFDLPNSKGRTPLGTAARELQTLAGNIELEGDEYGDEEDGEGAEDDNIEGWIDERVLMTEEELDKLDESVLPVRLLLTKVLLICFVIHNQLTNYNVSFGKPLLL